METCSFVLPGIKQIIVDRLWLSSLVCAFTDLETIEAAVRG